MKPDADIVSRFEIFRRVSEKQKLMEREMDSWRERKLLLAVIAFDKQTGRFDEGGNELMVKGADRGLSDRQTCAGAVEPHLGRESPHFEHLPL
jgi:hypothetical protein